MLLVCLLSMAYEPWGGVFVLGIVMLVEALAIYEFANLAIVQGFRPRVRLLIACAWGYSLVQYWSSLEAFNSLPQFVFFAAFVVIFLSYFKGQKNALSNIAISCLGLVYVAYPLSLCLDMLYFLPDDLDVDGRFLLGYTIAVCKGSDIGGFFFGRLFGRHKLAVHLSPSKTFEGLVGGVIFAIAISALFSLYGKEHFPLGLKASIAVGVLLAALSTLGDLAESLLKRDSGVKDSSSLPGLGGVLDVCDSLLFSMPCMVWLCQSKLLFNIKHFVVTMSP